MIPTKSGAYSAIGVAQDLLNPMDFAGAADLPAAGSLVATPRDRFLPREGSTFTPLGDARRRRFGWLLNIRFGGT